MARSAVAVGVLVVVLAGGIAWWALRDAPEEAPAGPAPGPRSDLLHPYRARELGFRDPWPHAAFEADFAALRSPDAAAPGLDEQELSHANALTLTFAKVSAKFDGATVEEVVASLRDQLAPKGVRVFTYDTGNELAHVRFRMDKDEIEVFRLIDELRFQSNEELRYYTTSQGLCLGSERAIQQAQLDARADIARRRAERDRDDPVLGKEFRPDFADAWAGPISRMIRDQTGIEVVVDQATWTNGRTVSWRADPMPLRQALDAICRELGCVARVRDGRVFLLAP